VDGGGVTGPEAARRLLASPLLRRLAGLWAGGEVFLTGGSLRDRLLDLPTHDLDLAVTGDARAAAHAFAAALGGRCFPLGRHPLVTWRVAGGRHHVDIWAVEHGVEHDIYRRDFTVNALFWRLPRGPLLDLVGGLDDLEAGRIRVVRRENLSADPLRVLRGIRLLATHRQLRLTAETEQQLGAAAAGLRSVARERICDELRTTLAGPGVERALLVAARIGVLASLLPTWKGYGQAPAAARLAAELAVLQHGRGILAPGARDAAVAVFAAPTAGFPEAWDPEAAAASLAEVGFPRAAATRAADAAALGERLLAALGRDAAAERGLAVEADDLIESAVAWAVARQAGGGEDLRSRGAALLRWGRRFASRRPLLAGDEIAELLGLPAGPARAAAVRALRLAQARGDVRTRSQALRFIRERAFR
jgi:tRNA nucleotidyltransferase/poly(A) polymerase